MLYIPFENYTYKIENFQNNRHLAIRIRFIAVCTHDRTPGLLLYNPKVLTLWLTNPEVQCCNNTGSPIIPLLSQIKRIPRIDNYFFKPHANAYNLRLDIPKGLLPEGLHVEILTTWPFHLYILDLITLAILG